MKKTKLLSLLLLLLAGAILFSSCNKDEPKETEPQTEAETEPAFFSLVQNGKPVYDIVYVTDAGSDMGKACTRLRSALDEATGCEHVVLEDWEYKKDNVDRWEILVGVTNRPESAEEYATVEPSTFHVTVKGKKILLVGKTDNLTIQAVNAFIEAYLTGKTAADAIVPANYSYVGQADSRVIDLSDPEAVFAAHVLTIATNSSAVDKEYIVRDTAAALPTLRFADKKAELIYRFDISQYASPYFELSVLQEYCVEIGKSIDGPWIKLSQQAVGANITTVGFDPFRYDMMDEVFIRFTDPTVENGGGAAVTNIKITYYDTQPISENIFYLGEGTKKAVLEMSKALSKIQVSDGFAIAPDGGMIFDPISQDKKDQLHKYDGSEKLTGTLTLGDRTLTYDIPKNVTAYDAVPLHYVLSTPGGIKPSSPLHISVTGQEDKERENGKLYYDLNLPGKVDLTYDYDGYVAGTLDVVKRPTLSLDFKKDYQSKAYPDFTVTELRRSGNVKATPFTWFRFTVTNTGNTVLDGDGNGTFAIHPVIQKKNASGGYDDLAQTPNGYIRIIDELYPGESQVVWFFFQTSLTPGEYRIRIENIVRNEIDNPENYGRTIWGGEIASMSTLDLTVSDSDKITEPALVKKNTPATLLRNHWMHYYEEFQSSYLTITNSAKDTEEGTIWVQLSPWCNQVVLKMIDGNKQTSTAFAAVSIPVQVESDSLKIELDPENPSYVVLEDGTRFPAIMTQSMADMRVNICRGPDTAYEITKYLCEMKDLGINVINTTAGFIFDNTTGGTAFQYSMDVARKLGLKVEGFVSYPYQNTSLLGRATSVNGNQALSVSKPGESIQDVANGVLAKYQCKRWGRNFWVNGSVPVLSVEDSRGGFGITTEASFMRPALSSEDLNNFRIFVKSLYGTVEEMNKAWGTRFSGFNDISFNEVKGTSTITTSGWSRSNVDLDLFQALRRANNYRTMIDTSGVKGAKVDLRLEGSNWVAKIDPDDKRQNMRYLFANQLTDGLAWSVLGSTDAVYCVSDYMWQAFRPSEVAELSRSSYEDCGIVSAMLPELNRMRTIAINPKYGKSFADMMNITGENVLGVQVNTTVSLYEWWKATYENHGVPGILWSDDTVDGYATATQRREIEFFVSKLKETIATPEGQKWAKEFRHDESALSDTLDYYSYDPSFVESEIRRYYDSIGK